MLLIPLVFVAAFSSGLAGETNSVGEPEAKDAAYTRVINDRANRILAGLNLPEAAKSNRVQGIIVQQYRDLNVIHEVRDAQIESAKEKAGADKAAATTAIEAVKSGVKPKLAKLHGEFLARLSRELSPEQVDKVKDGLTYGVAPLTYGVYLRMYPGLSDEQKAQIKTWLHEARELAMDGSTSDEKHAVFGKYKGKINNYLSKAGYDAKKGEANLKKTAQSSSQAQSK